MLGVTGWKTIVGVIFGAFAMILPQLKELLDPNIYKILVIASSFAGTVLTGLGIAHKIEKGANRIAGNNSQAGFIKLCLLPALMLSVLSIGLLLDACAPGGSATQQMIKKTDNPALINLASYADGLKAYVDAQEIYKPYRTILERQDPELSNRIKGYFSGAWAILKKWKAFGQLEAGDREAFRSLIRNISISIAQEIDKKNGGT